MLKANISLLIGIVALTGVASAQSENSAVVVEVGGQKFTMADVEQKEAGRLLQAKSSYFQAQKSAISSFVDEQILQRKADAEHLTIDQLLQRDVTSKITDPTEDQLKVLYEAVGSEEPYEKLRPKIMEEFHNQRVKKARADYMQKLREQADIAITLLPPGEKMSLDDAPTIGAKNALVTVVEYADYECPYCQQAYPVLKQLLHDFDGKVTFAFKEFPLPMHSHAKKAAEAAICAGVQGKFWEYHDTLFETRKLEIPELKEDAKTLGLNVAEFDNCLDSGAETAKVQHAYEEAQGMGLNGTPSFFINGHFYNGSMKYEQLRDAVEQELAAAREKRDLKASN